MQENKHGVPNNLAEIEEKIANTAGSFVTVILEAIALQADTQTEALLRSMHSVNLSISVSNGQMHLQLATPIGDKTIQLYSGEFENTYCVMH